MPNPWEAIDRLGQKVLDGGKVYLAHGLILDEAGAIFWVDGQGLYARVILAGDPMDGIETQAAVGGDMFSASGGGLHSRPIKRGEHVIVALIEGDPRGESVIVSRVSTVASQPAGQVSYRTVNESNVQRTAFDLLPDGVPWHIGLKNGSLHVRLEESGDMVFQMPDKAVLVYSNGVGWKIRSAGGSLMMCTDDVVQLKSRGGQSWLEIKDSGIQIMTSGGAVQINGQTLMLNMKSGDAPPSQSALFNGYHVPSAGGSPKQGSQSSSVYIGK